MESTYVAPELKLRPPQKRGIFRQTKLAPVVVRQALKLPPETRRRGQTQVRRLQGRLQGRRWRAKLAARNIGNARLKGCSEGAMNCAPASGRRTTRLVQWRGGREFCRGGGRWDR